MLRAIFYARFHPERGPSVVHQYPPNSVIPNNAESHETTLIDFSDISSYVIPPYEVCNGGLSILSADSRYRILGMPVSMESAKYSRNRFTFNVCFVLDADIDVRPWEHIVRKTARFFRDIEECDGLLQAEELLSSLRWAGETGYPATEVGIVFPLLRTMLEDLNKYGETSAVVGADDVHVLNVRVVQPRSPTVSIKAWQVPLLIRPWSSGEHWSCDPTLKRVCPQIDGVQPVQRIAERADVEFKLVKKALRELLRHQRILLLDIFHSQAVYSPTDDFAWLVNDQDMLDECSSYVFTSSLPPPSHATLINLYRQLGPGISVQDFCLTYANELSGIDVRRFIHFGVLKGFLRRLHKYALSVESQPSTPKFTSGSAPTRTPPSTLSPEKAWKTAALSSGWPNPRLTESPASANGDGSAKANGTVDTLARFLNGKHCMDEICLAMNLDEKKVVEMLRSGKYGEVLFVCK